MADLEVKGLSDLLQRLEELPVKFEQRIVRGALGAGCRVIATAAKQGVPVKSGALRDSIRVSSRATRGGEITAKVIAGSAKGANPPFYAHMIEFGTHAHVIHAKNAQALAFGNFFGKSVSHPGAKPRPFLRPAVDSQSEAATQAVADYIERRLEKLVSQ